MTCRRVVIGLLLGAVSALSTNAEAATLDVPLTVEESAGVVRRAEPVTSGLPLPRGLLRTGLLPGEEVLNGRGRDDKNKFRGAVGLLEELQLVYQLIAGCCLVGYDQVFRHLQPPQFFRLHRLWLPAQPPAGLIPVQRRTALRAAIDHVPGLFDLVVIAIRVARPL